VRARRPVVLRIAGVVAGLTVVTALVGCAGQDPRANEASGHGSHGDESGADHESGGHGDGSGHAAEEITPPPGADWNAADAAYVLDMIAHHRQAIDMSALVDDRASDGSVKRLASGIDAGQGAEILTMAAWLDQHDLPVPELEDIQDHQMPGMLTQDQMADLAAADGEEFDELYLTGMVQHHQGAIEMAERQVADGLDVLVVEMASEVIAGQTGEIDRMRQLLTG
jgi:uncharacterized protein (DUF305 family)